VAPGKEPVRSDRRDPRVADDVKAKKHLKRISNSIRLLFGYLSITILQYFLLMPYVKKESQSPSVTLSSIFLFFFLAQR
jgi:hypothetical protein